VTITPKALRGEGLWGAYREAIELLRPCPACKETIPAGQIYRRIASLYEDSWTTLIRCGRCERMYRRLCDERDNAEIAGERVSGDAVAPMLDCGHDWAAVYGDRGLPDDLAALAFARPGHHDAELEAEYAFLRKRRGRT